VTTKWVVTTASEQVALDETTRGGEATFMVTNQSPKPARAMFDIKTGNGVDESWFSIEDPQRPIRPAASVPYLVRIQVPQQVPPGKYEFEARVYPPDSAPEENFVLSRRVLLEVPKPPAPQKKPFPWWIVVAAALLVLVIGVVTWLVWPSGGTPTALPSASPSPQVSAAPVELVATPKLTGATIDAARKALTDAGLTLGHVIYMNSPSAANIVLQSVPQGLKVPKGSGVDVYLSMTFSRPVITAPGPSTSQPPGRWPTITWTQAEPYVKRWQVNIQSDRCTRSTAGGVEQCGFVGIDAYLVTAKELTGAMPQLSYAIPATGSRDTGWINVIIYPVDDTGTVGVNQSTSVKFYLDH
jgi:PASTA domain